MHRSSKRIVAPVFLLLAAAAIFVPEVRGVEVPMVRITWVGFGFFTLPQNPVPDFSGTIDFGGPTDTFGFIKVPVFTNFMPANTPLTYDVTFFRQPDRTQFMMTCDPPIFSPTAPPGDVCHILFRLEIPSLTAIWSGPVNNPTFIPGDYNGLIVSETPEPSTLALLLMSFATLSLLAVGVRPSHR